MQLKQDIQPGDLDRRAGPLRFYAAAAVIALLAVTAHIGSARASGPPVWRNTNMMIVQKMSLGQVDYLISTQAENYFVGGGEPPGRWIGGAAEAQGLTGQTVDSQAFRNLFYGLSADGQRYVRQRHRYSKVHAGCGKVREMRAGWELLFPVDKSVSAVWACSPDHKRHQIDQAVSEAVEIAVKYIEDHAAWTRRGHGGTRRERVKLIVADFRHCTARPTSDDLPPDPHVHGHAVVMNCGLRSDGSFGSLDSRAFYEYQLAAGAVFNATLAGKLRHLGFRCQPSEHGFHVIGVPAALCTHWSKRNRVVVERMDELGQHTAADGHAIAAETRRAKGHVPPRGHLLAFWQAEAQEYGLTPQFIDQLTRPLGQPTPGMDTEQVVQSAVKSVSATHDVFTEKDLVRHALDATIESGPDVETTMQATATHLKHGRQFIRLSGPEANREAIYTTTKTTNLQSALAKRLDRMMTERTFVPSTGLVNSAIDRYSRASNPIMDEVKFHFGQLVNAAAHKPTKRINRPLIREQAKQTLDGEDWKLVRQLTQFPGRATVIRNRYRGDAAVQRYVALRAATKAWKKAGYEVIFASPYRRTAKALEDATSAYSITFKKLELMMKPTFAYHAQHFAKQFVRAAFNRPTFSLDGYCVNDKRVLIVDRAEHLSLNQIAALVRDVDRHGGKIVLLTPHTDDLPSLPVNLTASLLNDLAQRLPTHMGTHPEGPAPKPPVQEQRPGLGIHP